MNLTRAELIEDVLIAHQHIKGGLCTCGFQTGIGRSLKRHPAEMVEAALVALDTHKALL